MQFTFAEITAWIGSFAWPWIRVSAMLLAAPLFSNVQFPVRLQVLFGMVLTVAVMPAVGPVPEVEPLSLEALLIAVQQVLIGIAIGALLAFAFGAIVIGGESISKTMGLGFATVVDPQGVSMPVLSQFFQVMATLIFLSLAGHLMLIELLAVSFSTIPVGMVGLGREEFWLLANFGTLMFAGGLLIAFPAVLAMLLCNLALGVMTRAAPQMNIFSVGFAMMKLVGFLVVLFLVMPVLAPRMASIWSDAFAVVRQVIGA